MSELKIDNSYGLADIQYDLLDIMKFIHKFCLENNIVYSLTGGSLLGSIRHQGFIPWDDDFDIMLDRENYEKFLKCMKEYKGEDYILEPDQWVYRVRKQHKADKSYVASIDLFVFDRVPKGKLSHKLQILKLFVLQGMMRDNHKKGDFSFFYKLCIAVTSLMGKFFKNEKLFESYDKTSQKGNKNGSDKLSIFNDRFKLISMLYDDDIMKEVELHTFEDTEFFITKKYEYYLVKQFGDYMQPPPEAERIPQHS